MGTRKKVKYSVYLDPEDSAQAILHRHLSNFKDKNAEAVRLLTAGFRVHPNGGAQEATTSPVVNVTPAPVNVTEPIVPTAPSNPVNVTQQRSTDLDPGWDE